MLKNLWKMLLDTVSEWQANKVPRMAAALAYYAVFSIAPLLIIVIAIAGLAFGAQAAQGEVFKQAQGLLGSSGAQILQTMIQNTSRTSSSILATVVGALVLMWGATQVFVELQDSLNTIWGVQPKPMQPIKGVFRSRVFSFGMILAIGFLLLVSLVISAVLSALGNAVIGRVPHLQNILQVANFLVSFGIITILFAAILKILPDVELRWRDVWIGAIVTSLLFTVGKYLISLYLGHASVGSTYGAAGSLVILLLWVNYSAQILFFGAEFAKIYACRHNARILPKHHAMRITKEEERKQGIVKPESESKHPPSRAA